MTAWGPLALPWLRRDARLPDRDLLQGCERTTGVMRLTGHDHQRWPVVAPRFGHVTRLLRTLSRRRQLPAGLLAGPGLPRWRRPDRLPDSPARAGAALTPGAAGLPCVPRGRCGRAGWPPVKYSLAALAALAARR